MLLREPRKYKLFKTICCKQLCIGTKKTFLGLGSPQMFSLMNMDTEMKRMKIMVGQMLIRTERTKGV